MQSGMRQRHSSVGGGNTGKKLMSLLFIVTVIVVLTAVWLKFLGGSDVLRKSDIESTKKSLQEAVQSVYAPESMQQFHDTKEKYAGKLFTQDAADDFWYHEGETLTADDLMRTVSVSVRHSERGMNDFGTEIYVADLTLSMGKGTVKNADIIFLMDSDGKVMKHEIQMKDSKSGANDTLYSDGDSSQS